MLEQATTHQFRGHQTTSLPRNGDHNTITEGGAWKSSRKMPVELTPLSVLLYS
jgi:hypothetical protein